MLALYRPIIQVYQHVSISINNSDRKYSIPQSVLPSQISDSFLHHHSSVELGHPKTPTTGLHKQTTPADLDTSQLIGILQRHLESEVSRIGGPIILLFWILAKVL